MEKIRNKRGITLIALVITIIVLLILTGVTVTIVVKSDILGATQRGTQEMEQQLKKEEELGNEFIIDGGVYCSIEEYVKAISPIDFETIFATAQPHEDQEATNKDIGIAKDGSIVNMDWWTYTPMFDYNTKCYHLGDGWGSSVRAPGYIGEIGEDGKIIGKMPMYIKEEGEDEFYPVTDISNLFAWNEDLIYAPEIPETVMYMDAAFQGCINLIQAPDIPASVKTIYETFANCYKLTGKMNINCECDSWDYSGVFYNAAIEENCNLILTGSSTILEDLLTTASPNSHISIEN